LQGLAKIIGQNGSGLFESCVSAAAMGATLGELTRAIRINDSPSQPITPVTITRQANPVEELRTAMNRFGQTHERPRVFLCNMGGLKDYKARADFARGFFAVGGYEAISPPGFKTPEDAAEAFAQSGARVATVCSTDEQYQALVPTIVPLLKAKRPGAIVILAGYPQEQVEAYRKAGVDDFIHIRADVVETLNHLHQKLGVA
jgi:methylmalonyl-CoA mutase